MTTDTLPSEPQTTLAERLSSLGSNLRRAGPRLRDFLVYAVAQERIYDKRYAGIMHMLIFWGVTIQIIGTAVNLMQMALFIPFVELPFPRNAGYLAYELVMDLAGVAILVGVGMAAYRRLVQRPKALESRWDDYYALIILTVVPLVGFTTEGLRLLSANPEWARWSPVGYMTARLFGALGLTSATAAALHPYFVLTHATLGLVFIASIPFTKLRHLVTAPLNIVLHPRRKTGELEKIEDIEETEILGVGQVAEFEPPQLLSFDACLSCGRCEEACPATICGMDYSPRILIQMLRGNMVDTLVKPNGNGSGSKELLGDVIPEELPWACTTCAACIERCPVLINPIDEIVDLRRYLALTTGKLPKSVADTLRNMERQGNPWGMPAEDRIAWAEGLDVRELTPGDETDVLLFLGCASAYDDRNKKVAQAFVRLLQKTGVDFGILGLDEICCGETARRLGHEYLFQVYAEQNIEVMSQVKFKRVVTQCPHCFNTLKNEYPQMGGDFRVMHYTELLNELPLPWETVSSNGVQGNVTYHDSCYLGRYNQIYKQPRSLLDQVGVDMVEMVERDEDSFCCGGGGGQMWLETDADKRINHLRLAQAMDVEADVVATACPYCLLMFDDAIRSKGVNEQVQVLDIAEILDKKFTTDVN